MQINKVNIVNKLTQFDDYWNPRILGELNGQHVKLAKFKGEFVWHKHDKEDELFYVIKGNFTMEFRDRKVRVSENELIIVPKGIEHRSVAEEEVSVMLFEPASTINTGETDNDLTRKTLEWI
jgi:mannose-6-phosphate isomerase-like protein (cupin superfamily)